MKSKIRLLNLVVSSTLILLAAGAVLAVLGIFNEGLHWDIFGPKLEAALQGVFGSCMALAGFGAAMTLIVAIQETVKDFKKFVRSRTNEEDVPDAGRFQYLRAMFCLVLVMATLVGVCALADHLVLVQRCRVFKRLAGEQISNFEPKILAQIQPLTVPPTHDVPRDFYDILKALDNVGFISRATVYMPDPSEQAVLWSFVAEGNAYTNTYGFNRVYIAKDFEKAVRRALDGNPADLNKLNDENEFIWYAPLPRNSSRPKIIFRIDGNSRESFREYRLGS